MKKITTLLALLLTVITFAQNHSLNFDGIDDYIELGENYAFEPADAFSIEAWIKVEDNDLKQIISKLGVEDNTFRGWGFQTNSSGYLSAYISDTWSVNTRFVRGTTILGDGNWHHVAMTYDGADSIILYLDGAIEPIGSQNIAGTLTTIATTSTTHIGNYAGNGNPGEYFDGSMDELRIWRGVRTPTEIQENHATEISGNEDNLIGYYKMDVSNSSCDIQDCSISEVHGDRNGSSGTNDTPQFSEDIPVLTDVACGATTNCVLAIDGLENVSDIQLYPNPTNGLITFNGIELTGNKVQVYNVLGKSMGSKIVANNSIDITSFPVGLYFVKIEFNQQVLTHKILKK